MQYDVIFNTIKNYQHLIFLLYFLVDSQAVVKLSHYKEFIIDT